MLLIHLLVHSYAKPPSSSQPTYSMNNAHEICQKKKEKRKKKDYTTKGCLGKYIYIVKKISK